MFLFFFLNTLQPAETWGNSMVLLSYASLAPKIWPWQGEKRETKTYAHHQTWDNLNQKTKMLANALHNKLLAEFISKISRGQKVTKTIKTAILKQVPLLYMQHMRMCIHQCKSCELSSDVGQKWIFTNWVRNCIKIDLSKTAMKYSEMYLMLQFLKYRTKQRLCNGCQDNKS